MSDDRRAQAQRWTYRLRIAAGVVALIVLVGFVLGQVLRSGEASVHIDLVTPTDDGRYKVDYSYVVNGHLYITTDWLKWEPTAALQPKVCYRPNQPENRVLVPADDPCGLDLTDFGR